MLTHIAQKGKYIDFSNPIQIIHNLGRILAARKIDKLTHLTFKLINPISNHISSIELTLLRFEAWITNQPRGAAHQGNRLVAGKLEAFEHQQRHQATNMQTVRSRIKATIKGATARIEMLDYGVAASHLCNKSAGLQLLQEISVNCCHNAPTKVKKSVSIRNKKAAKIPQLSSITRPKQTLVTE